MHTCIGPGLPNDHVTINSVSIKPDPPKKGESVEVQADVSISKQVHYHYMAIKYINTMWLQKILL